MPLTPSPDARLRSFVQILQQHPANYRAFGWLWWPVKAMLKAHYSQAELSLLGECSNTTCVRVATKLYPKPDDLINAAVEQYQDRTQRGQAQASDDHMPDGAPIRVTDPDAGFANAQTTDYAY
jgi:hypothetical protein